VVGDKARVNVSVGVRIMAKLRVKIMDNVTVMIALELS